MNVVAEGVETPEQLAQLANMRCGAQGYLSVPMPAPEARPWSPRTPRGRTRQNSIGRGGSRHGSS